MTMRVLVTCPPMLGIFDEVRHLFDAKGVRATPANVVQTLTEEELVALVPKYDGWIIGDDPATAKVLETGTAGLLKAIVKWGVGVDNVDFVAANRLGLRAANTPGVFGREVADIAVNYVTGLARDTFYIDREIRSKCTWPKPAGISLAERTAAVVGCGDIGRNTAKRLLAADMRVIVYDPAQPATNLPVELRQWPDDVDEADFLIFTCPLLPSTHYMFNEELLPKLKPGVRVVNVARGPIIDERALLTGLETGLVHSAALDVFEIEPLAPTSPLRRYNRCVFGSHNASNSRDAAFRVSVQATAMMLDFLKLS